MYSINQNQDEANRGIHINHHDKMASQPCPQWVIGFNKDFWASIGVVIWERTYSRVFHFSPHQDLDVLDALKESSAWKDNSFYLSWISYSMPFSEEKEKACRTTKNRLNSSVEGEIASNAMILAPEQTQELFVFLEKREDELHALVDIHTKEVRKALGRVYAFLIELGDPKVLRYTTNYQFCFCPALFCVQLGLKHQWQLV